MKGRAPMISALALASDEIALILSFIRSRARRRSARLPSASDEAAAGLDLDGDGDGEEVHLRLVDDPRHPPERAVERLAEHHPLADRAEVAADRIVVLLPDPADALDHRQAGADAADDGVDARREAAS